MYQISNFLEKMKFMKFDKNIVGNTIIQYNEKIHRNFTRTTHNQNTIPLYSKNDLKGVNYNANNNTE